MVEKIQGWKAEMINRDRIKQKDIAKQESLTDIYKRERIAAKERNEAIEKFVAPREPKEKKILRQTREKIEKLTKQDKATRELRRTKLVKVRGREGKVTTERVSMGEYRREMVARVFRSKSERKAVAKRATATRGVLTAMGIIQGKQTSGGAGRPRGTFKHGMPIHIYKKMLRDRKSLYQRYQDEQNLRLKTRGFTREQLQQLQQQQAVQELQEPMQEEVQEQEIPQEYQDQQVPQQLPQNIQQPQSQPQENYGRVLPRSQYPVPPPSVADDELRFRQWSAERTISPRTQSILDRLRRIQNKGKTDNIEQQRRHRERKMVGESMNPFKAHLNMVKVNMNFTGVPEDNILMAPSVFKENPDNFILRKRGGNLLDTRSYGNDLKFF